MAAQLGEHPAHETVPGEASPRALPKPSTRQPSPWVERRRQARTSVWCPTGPPIGLWPPLDPRARRSRVYATFRARQRPELARSAPRAEENRVREVIRSGVEGEVRTPAAAPPGGVAVGHGAALGAHQPPTGRASRSGTVVDALAARDGLVFAIAARRARREVLRRADVALVAAVGAAVRAGRDVAPCWNWVRHVGDVPDAPAVKRRDVGSGPSPAGSHPDPDTSRRGALQPTALIDFLERKKPLRVFATTQVTPAKADVQRNRPTTREEP